MNKRQKKKAWKNRLVVILFRRPGTSYQYVNLRMERTPKIYIKSDISKDHIEAIRKQFNEAIQKHNSFRTPIIGSSRAVVIKL